MLYLNSFLHSAILTGFIYSSAFVTDTKLMGNLKNDYSLFLFIGFWSDKEELKRLRQTDLVFKPQKGPKEYELAMSNWTKAVQRCLHWYNQIS